MANFIELHLAYNGKPILINEDWIITIEKYGSYSYVYVGIPDLSSNDNHEKIKTGIRSYTVRESYYKIKSML